jgi:hypothetical protein
MDLKTRWLMTAGADGLKSGPGVWMEYGGTRSTNTMYCCGISPSSDRKRTLVVEGVSLELVDDENFRKFDKLLHPKHTTQRASTLSGPRCVAGYLLGTKAWDRRAGRRSLTPAASPRRRQ